MRTGSDAANNSHCIKSKLICCKAPNEICFTSSLRIKLYVELAMCSHALRHADLATPGKMFEKLWKVC
uniref:CSON001118 protein n=1 Tax=Culicoides sonorensis TaxID=179676 RepID=A0A336MKB7_CULSO